ncbi:MAG TPA: hypothetical protein VIJ75_14160 [Hanamia sp.]
MRNSERFLSRGNHIEIVKTGLLKDYGGIVLIENESMNAADRRLVNSNINPRNDNAFLF